MDHVGRDLEKAEREASPGRSPESFPDGTPKTPKIPDQSPGAKLDTAPIERQETTISSSSTSSSLSASAPREPMGMSRVDTQRDLERHPTELSRIETHRTQHSGTVGRTTTSRKSKKPLPNFGGGKDYPATLPSQEEYVVEFDGPDDPLHPQNWPFGKKSVFV